jgi:MFS family permease
MSSSPPSFLQKTILGLPLTIWGIGLAVMCINVSSVIVFSLYPTYLTSILGLSALGLGYFEGAVEFLSWTMRIFSGLLSDALSRRKPILLIAAALIALSRPLFALSHQVFTLFLARSLDRLGNGLQATPREALVSDWAPHKKRGASFGLRQTMGYIGSFLGAAILLIWTGNTIEYFQNMFWLATIGPVIACVILLFWVKDRITQKPKGNLLDTFSRNLILTWRMPRGYWVIVVLASFYSLSNYSGAFLMIHARCVAGAKVAALVMIFQNLSSFLVGYPIGRLGDRIDQRWLLVGAFSCTIFSNLFLAYASDQWGIIAGSFLWGIQVAVVQNIMTVKILDNTPENLRGTAFGLYYVIMGIALFVANAITGKIVHEMGSYVYGFHFSSLIAFISLFFIPLLIRPSLLKGLS